AAEEGREVLVGLRPANSAEHRVAMLEQKLGEERPVLAADAGDQRAAGAHAAPPSSFGRRPNAIVSSASAGRRSAARSSATASGRGGRERSEIGTSRLPTTRTSSKPVSSSSSRTTLGVKARTCPASSPYRVRKSTADG